MIRPFTCVCLLLAAGSGLYTYQAKHQAELLDDQISQVVRQTGATRQRISVLRAEYELLNDPQRLSELTGEHLPQLRPTEPTQFTTLADLDHRLPPVGPPPRPPQPVTEPTEAAPVTPPATPPSADVPMAAATPERRATEPVIADTAMAAAEPVGEPAPPALPPVAPVSTAVTALGAARTAAPRPPMARRLAQAGGGQPARERAPAPRYAAVRAPRPDPLATPVVVPSETIARVAQAGFGVGGGVGRSGLGGTGGATFSSLGMARTGAYLAPPVLPAR